MKQGETFKMTLQEFARPMIGKLVDVTTINGEKYRARVLSIDAGTVKLAVVPNSLKE